MPKVVWRSLNPHNGEWQNEEGKVIADPIAVLRLSLFDEEMLETFSIFTPAVTGVLERVVWVPVDAASDPNTWINPGVGGLWNIYAYQHISHYPLPLQDTNLIQPYAEPEYDNTDILNGYGVGLTDAGQIVHLVSAGHPAAGNGPIIQRLLCQDSIRLDIEDWSDGQTAGKRRADLYFYFKKLPTYESQAVPGQLIVKEYWSAPAESVILTDGGTNVALPSVVLPNIAGTITEAYLMVKFRIAVNTHVGAANMLNTAQNIQVRESLAGAYVTGIVMPDNGLLTPDNGNSNGDTIVGSVNVSGQVALMNRTYLVQWTGADVDFDNLELHDIQCGIRVTLEL